MSPSVSSLISRSALMQAFNKARLSGAFEPRRLNRALGIAQRNTTRILPDGRLDTTGADWHLTTLRFCDCADHKQAHTRYCKHIIAYMLLYRAVQYSSEVSK